MTDEPKCWTVKVKKATEKRYSFVAAGGKLNGLRIHALRFTHEGAQNFIAVNAADNPDYEFRTQKL